MSICDDLLEIRDKASKLDDKLRNASRILRKVNKGDEIGEVMDEIEEVIEIIEGAQAEIY